MRHIASIGFAIGLAICGFACDSGDDGVNCSFAACGGDPTGEWSIDGFCVDSTALEDSVREFCPSASASLSVSASGTIAFDADNTYNVDSTVTQTAVITLPADCFDGTQITSCSELDDPDGDLTCTGSPTSSCRCLQTSTDEGSESGTWSVSGDMLTAGDTLLFCQDGDVLKAQTIPTDPDDLQVTIVLSRM